MKNLLMSTELKTIPFMEKFLHILEDINQVEYYPDFFYSEADANYFKNTFIYPAVRFIIKTKTFNNP